MLRVDIIDDCVTTSASCFVWVPEFFPSDFVGENEFELTERSHDQIPEHALPVESLDLKTDSFLLEASF